MCWPNVVLVLNLLTLCFSHTFTLSYYSLCIDSTQRETYRALVFQDGQIVGSTVSRGLPSETETRIYFLGAGVDFPVES